MSAASSAQAWMDSVYSKAPSAEASLQFLLDSLGYNIDVANDELGIETFCVDSGMNHAIMILEVAGSSASAHSGYYIAGDSTSKTTLFTATSSPGDSTGFSFGTLDSVGFWMKPNITSTPQTWYSEVSLNEDDTDHVWIFSTGVPHEYLICFEDLPNAGDGDYQDLVLRVRFANNPPQLALSDTTVFACASQEVCFDVSAFDNDCHVDSVTLELISGPATFGPVSAAGSIDTSVCFTPTATGSYDFVFKATGTGGLETYDTVTVDFTLNSAPVATCPGDDTQFVCDLGQICISGFNGSDVDGNLSSVVVTGGTLSGDTVCFTPVAGANVITLIATDACGLADTCQTTITVNLNQTPVASCPGNDTMFVCDLSDICIPGFTASDADGNISSVTVTGGTVSGDTVCFTPVAGNNVITLIATDACGQADTCQTTIYIDTNHTPTASCPSVPTQFVCSPGDQLCIDGFSASDADGNLASTSAVGGTLNGTEICFIPAMGSSTVNTLIFIATDSCGAADTCSVSFDVIFNSPPVVSCPTVDTQFVCSLGQLCIGGFQATDPNNNLASATINGQAYTIGSQYCFTPVAGSNQLTFIAVDSCGAADTCTILVPVQVNTPPTVSCPPIDTVFACNLGQLCVNGFSATDPDGNLASVIAAGGTVNGSQVCIASPVAGFNAITYIATDSCGVADTCLSGVFVIVNQPPTALCPPADTMFACAAGQVCIDGFAYSDPDGNIASRTVSPGTLNGSQVCFNAVAGMNTITHIVTDSCGKADTCQTFVFVQINRPPSVTCPTIDTIKVCDFSQQICVTGWTVTDADGNAGQCTINGQPFNPTGAYCFVPTPGSNSLTFECTDQCGATAQCTLNLVVVADDPSICSGCPDITIEKVHEVIQGTYQNVSVDISNLGFDIGAFDLLIKYDPSALSFTSAAMGQFLLSCQWEYFQYRNGASGNCGSSPCPSGVLRVAAIADINNGPAHPICRQPAGGAGQLVELRFLVTNDRTMECTYVPIRFIWYDCGDNTLSSPVGDSLYISDQVYDYYDNGNYVAISDPNAAFPTYFGANSSCDVAIGDGKPDPFRCIDFYNGGIDIACAESLDARGDINLNEIPNEVADIVLFSRYFVYGFSVFTINMQGQIAATDVNADGLALSVADLVYQIRIVAGDANPFPKLAPVSVEYGIRGGTVWVDSPVGAAFLTVAGEIAPSLRADNMEMQYSYDAEKDNTRILVFGMDRGDEFSGDFVDIQSGELLSIEMATYEGAPVTPKLVPSTFALHQNYPNPFNPTTVISFALPHQSNYVLTIFNATGQTVERFTGSAGAGEVEIGWDASGVASGIYFYRLEVEGFTETRKMVLLK